MKDSIHPEYFDTIVRCACGSEVQTRTTLKDIHVEICQKCHPYFTGTQKLMDTSAHIEKFKRKYANVKSTTSKQEETASPQ